MIPRRPPLASPALALVLGVVAASGCADKAGEAADDARRVAATSSADATVAIESDELGFSLDRPGEGWKLLQRADAVALVPGALAGALSPDGISAVVRMVEREGEDALVAQAKGEDALAAQAKGRMSELELDQLAVGEGAALELGGLKAHQLEATGTRAGVPLRFGLALVEQGDRVWELWAWGAAAATQGESFLPFYRAFHPRDAARGARADAGTAPEAEPLAGAVTATQSLRGKVFHDYEHGVVVTLPDGWRGRAGASARAVDAEASLYLERSDPRIEVRLIVEDAGELDGPRYHDEARAHLATESGARLGPATEAEVGELSARLSQGSAGKVGQRLWTAVDEGLALQLIAAGSEHTLGGKELAALLRGVELRRGVRAVEMTTEVYRDNRLGFELRPPARMRHAEVTPASLAARGSMVRWEGNGRWLAVVAVHAGRSGDGAAWMAAFLEQLLRQELGPAARGPAERTPVEIAGHPAVRISWGAPLEHLDALIVLRGELIYAIMSLDHSGALFQSASLDFKLLP